MKVKKTCIIACFVIALLGMRRDIRGKMGIEDVIEKGQIGFMNWAAGAILS